MIKSIRMKKYLIGTTRVMCIPSRYNGGIAHLIST